MELFFAIFHALHEGISGQFNHPRFGNGKAFRFIAPILITALFLALGATVTLWYESHKQVGKLEKDITSLKFQQLTPTKEANDKLIELAKLQASYDAQKERITDLERQLTEVKTENISLRERVFNKDPVKRVPVEKPKNSDSILESSNRRLKRLGDKKDDPLE